MSYVYTNASHLAFFVPNIPLANNAAEVLKEIDIGASSADHGELICVKACKVYRAQFVVTGEIVGGTSAAPTVLFKKRPTPLSATSESTVATLTIPDTTAIGKVVYKDFEPVSFAVGDSMEISHTVGTGSPTGMGHYSFLCLEAPEESANNSDMVESA